MNKQEVENILRLTVIAAMVIDSGDAPEGFKEKMDLKVVNSAKFQEAVRTLGPQVTVADLKSAVLGDFCDMLLEQAEEVL